VQIARLIWHAALQQCNFRRHVPKWHFCQLCGHWAYPQPGYRAGTVIEALRADRLDPFDVWRSYLHSLPDTGAAGTLAEAVDSAR
jgi:hypothetical protein